MDASESDPTLGDEVMDSTKNADDVTIVLPDAMRAILQWHIDTFLVERTIAGTKRINKSSQRMAASELLFPSPGKGSFQVAGRLGKPFDDVSKIMRERVPGFTKTITPKSMRRTNKDLLRQEGVSPRASSPRARRSSRAHPREPAQKPRPVRSDRLLEIDPAGHRLRAVGGEDARRRFEEADSVARDLGAELGGVGVEPDDVHLRSPTVREPTVCPGSPACALGPQE